MIYSLNEIDVHCKKAARGAGFEWGHAEDIGKAIRWLAAYDLPGTELLAAYLKAGEHDRTLFSQPDLSDLTRIRSSGGGNLCPVLTGACLCDYGAIGKNSRMSIDKLSFPLLLLPFLAQIADTVGQTLTFEFQSVVLVYSKGMLTSNDDTGVNCTLAQEVRVSMDDTIIEGKPAAVVGQETATADWMILNHYAMKTYVAATEASRLGAGPTE